MKEVGENEKNIQDVVKIMSDWFYVLRNECTIGLFIKGA